jgi:cytochrome c-type protein NapB
MRHLIPFLAAAGVSLVVGLAPWLAAGAGIDDLMSLRGPSAVDDAGKHPDLYGTVEGHPYGRAYRQQPPLIPHRIDKYEIDLKTNQCLGCHAWPYNAEYNAPKVSETHYTDREGNRLDTVTRGRWFCVQCHVPQSDAPALVDNTFMPAVK